MGLIDRLRTIQSGSRNAVIPAWPPGQDNDWCSHPAQRRRVAKAASHVAATCR